jgi:hypothetical protein
MIASGAKPPAWREWRLLNPASEDQPSVVSRPCNALTCDETRRNMIIRSVGGPGSAGTWRGGSVSSVLSTQLVLDRDVGRQRNLASAWLRRYRCATDSDGGGPPTLGATRSDTNRTRPMRQNIDRHVERGSHPRKLKLMDLTPYGCLGAVTHIYLTQKRLNMNLNRGLGEVEIACNDLVRRSLAKALQHFGFARR